MPITAEDVLRVVQQHGPIVPNRIKQELKEQDSMLINVYLAELKHRGSIKLTHVQLGSSSFAYTPEQTSKLVTLTPHLNEKNRRVAAQLQQASVLRARTADPLTRVALGTIKDFAKPITVKTTEGEELFYRWFEIDAEHAANAIKALLAGEQQTATTEPTPAPKEATPTEEKPPQEPARPRTEPTQEVLTADKAETAFGTRLLRYCNTKGITVTELQELRKGKEITCTAHVPSAVGTITYHCRATDKKRSNDGDLATTILAAKRRMLPALYITTGSVTKKARQNKELQEVQVVELGSRD